MVWGVRGGFLPISMLDVKCSPPFSSKTDDPLVVDQMLVRAAKPMARSGQPLL
jgi:hypothetical protein